MIIGYARVSTIEQNLDRQMDSLGENGAEKIFTEKVTGKKSDRTELMWLMEQLRDGDVVIISELTRLSRSTKDLFSIVEQIQAKGANIRSLKETWLEKSPPGIFSKEDTRRRINCQHSCRGWFTIHRFDLS